MDDDAIHARARELAKERIKPLTEQAETGGRAVTHENLSIKFFFNAANDMLKNGRQCVAEGDYERAYVLLMRFTEFFIHRLPLHAGFKGKEPAVASERKKLSKEVNAVLTELEMIKEEVLSKYTAEAEVQVRAELAEAAAAQAAAEAAAAAAAAQAEEQRAAAEALAVARAADEEEAAADARARQMERERAAQAAANADYYAELANRCQECSESDMPSYPSMDPRGAVGGAVPQPPPPGYGETVTAQSATLLQPPPGSCRLPTSTRCMAFPSRRQTAVCRWVYRLTSTLYRRCLSTRAGRIAEVAAVEAAAATCSTCLLLFSNHLRHSRRRSSPGRSSQRAVVSPLSTWGRSA